MIICVFERDVDVDVEIIKYMYNGGSEVMLSYPFAEHRTTYIIHLQH